MDKVPADFDLYWVIYHTLSSLDIWLTGLFVIVTAALPFLTITAITNGYPTFQDVVDSWNGERVYRVNHRNTARTFNAHTNQGFNNSDC